MGTGNKSGQLLHTGQLFHTGQQLHTGERLWSESHFRLVSTDVYVHRSNQKFPNPGKCQKFQFLTKLKSTTLLEYVKMSSY